MAQAVVTKADAPLLAKKKKPPREGTLRVPLSRLRPNSWNPNEMTEGDFRKLKRNLKAELEETKELPPLIVRPMKSYYEIVDGEHRWKAMKELGETHTRIFSWKLSDKRARMLTDMLNWSRGSPNEQKRGQAIVEMIEHGATLQELEEALAPSKADLEAMIDMADFTVKAFESLNAPAEEKEGEDKDERGMSDEDVFVEYKFYVSTSQMKVIDAELKRIGAKLKGKNKQSRCLEYMAVMSSQGELPEDLA